MFRSGVGSGTVSSAMQCCGLVHVMWSITPSLVMKMSHNPEIVWGTMSHVRGREAEASHVRACTVFGQYRRYHVSQHVSDISYSKFTLPLIMCLFVFSYFPAHRSHL